MLQIDDFVFVKKTEEEEQKKLEESESKNYKKICTKSIKERGIRRN